MSNEIRMTLLHHSTNDLIEELLMWRGLAAEHLDRIAELEAKIRHNALWQASEDAEERAHLEKLVLDLKKRIAELEAAQRWIPVSERLPEEDTDGNTLMAICRHSGEWVRAPFGAEFADEFVRHYSYWMYAPQPPEAQE